VGPADTRASRRVLPERAASLRLQALTPRNAHDILDEPSPPADERIPYGPHELQFADLRRAEGPVALLVHGGVWKAEYDLAHFGALAEALRRSGIATVNVEYRRVGNGGGWPSSLADVVAAVERFEPRVVVGHSAGGHLALLAAKRTQTPVVAVAAVTDPHTWDNPGVRAFFGGDVPDAGSPLRQLPLGVPAVLVHGTRDDAVPVEHSRRYAEAAGAELVELEGAGHFEPVDPQSAEWTSVRDAIRRLA
jgi:acetyl esterase/lipase